MTLLAGIICIDGTVIASDSQTTWTTGKTWSTKKLHEVPYRFGRALVSESGAAITSDAMIEALGSLALDPTLFVQHQMRGIAEMAAQKVRQKLRTQNFNCSSEELQAIIERQKLEAELMIAHIEPFGMSFEPRLDTISLSLGLCRRAKKQFDVVGSGADLASYLLGELCTPGMDCATASVVAVHVVETVKRHDSFCGGPTRLAILKIPKLLPTPGFDVTKHTIPESYFDYLRNDSPHPLELPPGEVAEIVKMVEDVQAATKQKHGEMIREALSQRSAKRMEEMMQTFYPQQAYDDAWKPPGDKSWD